MLVAINLAWPEFITGQGMKGKCEPHYSVGPIMLIACDRSDYMFIEIKWVSLRQVILNTGSLRQVRLHN